MVASKSSAAQPTTIRKPGGFLFQHPDAERLTHQLADAMGLTGAARDDLRHRLEHDIQNLGDFLGFTPGMVVAVEEMALGLYRGQKIEDAAQIFTFLIALAPHSSSGYRGLGACCQSQGRHVDAAQAYLLAYAVDNDDTVAQFLAGECLCEIGQAGDGLSLLREASASTNLAMKTYQQRARRYLSRSAAELDAIAHARLQAKAETQAQADEAKPKAATAGAHELGLLPTPNPVTPPSPAVAPTPEQEPPAAEQDRVAAAAARAAAPAVAHGDEGPESAAAMEAFITANLPALAEGVRSRRISLRQLGGFSDAQMEAVYAVACNMLERGVAIEAMREASWLIWLDSRNPRYYQLLGLSLHHLGWYCMAEYFYEWALIYDPKDPATLIYRGEAKIFSDEVQDGMRLLEDGLQLAGSRHEFAEVAQRARTLLQHTSTLVETSRSQP